MKIISVFIFNFLILFFSISQAEDSFSFFPETANLKDNMPKMEKILTSADDQDIDGIADQWEKQVGLDISRDDSQDDPDKDGVSNLNEFKYGSNPFSKDTDEDQLTDKEEISSYGTDPVNEDTDGDGKSDNDEIAKGSNPLHSDDENSSDAEPIHLKKGWNLISLPASPIITKIETVLAPIAGLYSSVWSYQNGKWNMYKPNETHYSNLAIMDSGWGYWIQMDSTAKLPVSGTVPPASIDLLGGWNLIGYNLQVPKSISEALKKLDGKYISVWGFIDGKWKSYNPEKPEFSDLTTLEPGHGYWVNMAAPSTLSLP